MTTAPSLNGRICCVLVTLFFAAPCMADTEPTLELYSPYAVYTSGTPLSLPVRLSLVSSAPHGWTISCSEGALTVERLLTEVRVGRRTIKKEIRPLEVASSPNSETYFQQMAERKILEPGKSIELHLMVFGAVGDNEDGVYEGFSMTVPSRPHKPPRTRPRGRLAFQLRNPVKIFQFKPGKYWLKLHYELAPLVTPLTQPVTPMVVSNEVTFEVR